MTETNTTAGEDTIDKSQDKMPDPEAFPESEGPDLPDEEEEEDAPEEPGDDQDDDDDLDDEDDDDDDDEEEEEEEDSDLEELHAYWDEWMDQLPIVPPLAPGGEWAQWEQRTVQEQETDARGNVAVRQTQVYQVRRGHILMQMKWVGDKVQFDAQSSHHRSALVTVLFDSPKEAHRLAFNMTSDQFVANLEGRSWEQVLALRQRVEELEKGLSTAMKVIAAVADGNVKVVDARPGRGKRPAMKRWKR